MSQSATREYTMKMRERYRAMRTKRARGRILDDYCGTTGLSRKHAIRVLRGECARPGRTGRKSVYSGSREALMGIWMLFDRPCSKLLHPVMDSRVAAFENLRGSLKDEIRAQLLGMSPSTMDRLLKRYRSRRPAWRGGHGPMVAMKREIPLREGRWDHRGAGWMEADTVAHCGGNMAGSFAYTLLMTDSRTQWTEMRSVWNRGGFATQQALARAEAALPFELLGIHTDNGPEFLNGHVVRHFRERATPQTRSRPYHKNDNPRAEQKNGAHVRTLLGYDRFDKPDSVALLDEILTLYSRWCNLFRPCMRLLAKERIGHQYRKHYDPPATPAQRVLADPSVPEARKQTLKKHLAENDCLELKLKINRKMNSFWREYVAVEPAAGGSPPSALRAAPSGTGGEPPAAPAIPLRRTARLARPRPLTPLPTHNPSVMHL